MINFFHPIGKNANNRLKNNKNKFLGMEGREGWVGGLEKVKV